LLVFLGNFPQQCFKTYFGFSGAMKMCPAVQFLLYEHFFGRFTTGWTKNELDSCSGE